ncbi:MAG: hypothetical protein V3R89_06865 [Thermoanaerobaculia bacterium]
MNCQEARQRLTVTMADPPEEAVTQHLESCPACARYAARLKVAVRLLRSHHAELEPAAGFAARVVAALAEPAPLLGWAALRLLPATLALVLVLSGWCWLAAPSPSALLSESPIDDLLSWVLESPESEP